MKYSNEKILIDSGLLSTSDKDILSFLDKIYKILPLARKKYLIFLKKV